MQNKPTSTLWLPVYYHVQILGKNLSTQIMLTSLSEIQAGGQPDRDTHLGLDCVIENPRGFQIRTTWMAGPEIEPPRADMQRLNRSEYPPLWIAEKREELWLWEPGFSFFLNLEDREGEAKLSRPRQWQDILRVLYFYDYLLEGGLLLHASAVARGDFAYIFPGESGAGKTTIVRQSSGKTILNDEIAVVQVGAEAAGATAFGAPFYGDWGQPGEECQAPVKGLFFPYQDRENRLVPLTPQEALVRLIPCVCIYTSWRPRLERVIDLCLRLVATVPVYEFHFRPDPSLWEVL